MTNQTIKQILIKKGVKHLYHANTVATTCTFLKNGGLLSRGAVEKRGLYQTPQETDDSDKNLDVFYDIFFDTVDIHKRTKNINYYGPIVFVYSIYLLDTVPENSIKITKDNPIRWTPEMEEDERYFLSEKELDSGFIKGHFTNHLTLRHQTEPLPFTCLEKIVIDDPGVKDTSYFNNAYSYLKDLINKCAPGVSFEVRECEQGCQCKEKYNSYQKGYIYHRFKYL